MPVMVDRDEIEENEEDFIIPAKMPELDTSAPIAPAPRVKSEDEVAPMKSDKVSAKDAAISAAKVAQEIQEKLDDQSAVVLKFAENGELPGKATIQVKVDYAMREYLGTGEPLCVYYFNNQTGKLELIAENLVVINDTYVEFAITHCSYYVLTQKIAEEPEEPEEPGDVKLGDVNGDGKINPKDAAMVLQHFVGKPVTDFDAAAADVNHDGKINPKDAAMILQRFVGKLDENYKPLV